MMAIPRWCPIIPVKVDATKAERAQAFFDHVEDMRRSFPGRVLPVGVVKRWWQFGVIEHPFTSRPELLDMVEPRPYCGEC